MGIGEVIRPLKNSLDGVPVHVRQLADMFRKHSQRQDLNRSQVTALDNVSGAWRTDTHWTPNAVVSWKGDAPDPGDYLDGDYISQHLARFDDGASRIYFSDTLHTYGPGQRDGSTFVFPTSELDEIIRNADGDVNIIADQLGMERSWFFDDNGDPLPLEVRHFDPSELSNLRMPSGNEAGLSCDTAFDLTGRDRDGDTVPDLEDNCPDDPNTEQSDLDFDGIGDACDDSIADGIEALGDGGCTSGDATGGLALALVALALVALRRRRA